MIFRELDTPAYLFRCFSEGAAEYLRANPGLMPVIRSVSVAYREEKKEACTAVAVARDLERLMKDVGKTAEIKVTAMRPVVRETGVVFDPASGQYSKLLTQGLEEIVL